MVQLAASKMQPLISKLQPLRSGTAVCLLLTLTALYAAICAMVMRALAPRKRPLCPLTTAATPRRARRKSSD